MVNRVPYDEFSMFGDNAAEYGIPYADPPAVRREKVLVSGGRSMSALVWGTGSPQVVFLHGGAQNAHTWDTVVLALGAHGHGPVSAVCVDLPGHGHSDSAAPWAEGATPLSQNADDIAMVMRALAPDARCVVGMSLGGLTSIALSQRYPDIVRRLVLIDITPGVNQEKTKQITDFVNGPATFPSFDELLARTMQFNPTRSESSLRRGILHNALQLDDGSWVWRYRRSDAPPLPEMKDQVVSNAPSTSADASTPFTAQERPSMNPLWDALSEWSETGKQLLFVRGMRPQSVVSDDDEAELLRRVPGTRVEHIAEAGHSVQGDTPLELAALIRDFALQTD
jgi:esterase